MKLVCERGRQGRVLGMHILGPSAGEVAQGFAVAIRLGATKDDFDSTVGIHPTHAGAVSSLLCVLWVLPLSLAHPPMFTCPSS